MKKIFRNIFTAGFAICSLNSFSQTDSVTINYTADTIDPDDTIKAHWPYIKNKTPQLVGALVGYNFLQNHEMEIGTILNITESIGTTTGMMMGPSLLYRRSIDRNLNAVDFNLGFYWVLSCGLGVNYNFDDKKNHLTGVRPFIGITLYHIQLLYGYNFYNGKNNDMLKLKHAALTLRLAIPIARLD